MWCLSPHYFLISNIDHSMIGQSFSSRVRKAAATHESFHNQEVNKVEVKSVETRGHRDIWTAPTFQLFILERRSCSCTWMKSCWSVQKHKVLHSFINTHKQSSVVDSKTFILYWLEKYRDPKREKKKGAVKTIPEHPWLKSPKRLHFINWMQLLNTELMCSK